MSARTATPRKRAALAFALSTLLSPVAAAHMTLPFDVPVHETSAYGIFNVEQLELRSGAGDDVARWDAHGWYGGDYARIWLRTEGEYGIASGDTHAEAQLLYSRLVAPFWELQGGLRYERTLREGDDADLVHGVIGVQGTAPYRIETTAALFVSEDGDVSARATFLRDLLITQRWSALARVEVEAASARDRDFERASGLTSIELGLRVHYRIRRECLPYLGVSWVRRLGNTADLARRTGGGASDLQFVAGVSFWF